jgi:hypothetical protein
MIREERRGREIRARPARSAPSVHGSRPQSLRVGMRVRRLDGRGSGSDRACFARWLLATTVGDRRSDVRCHHLIGPASTLAFEVRRVPEEVSSWHRRCCSSRTHAQPAPAARLASLAVDRHRGCAVTTSSLRHRRRAFATMWLPMHDVSCRDVPALDCQRSIRFVPKCAFYKISA